MIRRCILELTVTSSPKTFHDPQLPHSEVSNSPLADTDSGCRIRVHIQGHVQTDVTADTLNPERCSGAVADPTRLCLCACRGPVRLRSKHACMTMYGFSLVILSRTLVLSAALSRPMSRAPPGALQIRGEKQFCHGCPCDTHLNESQKQLVDFVCLNR